MDNSIRLPGGMRIGIDGIIGLIPGFGDLVAASLTSYIIVVAARMGIPGSILIRMGLNVLLELLIGTIPVVGDLFDFAFKANDRNVKLIETYTDNPRKSRTRSNLMVVSVLFALSIVIGIAILSVLASLGFLWRIITA